LTNIKKIQIFLDLPSLFYNNLPAPKIKENPCDSNSTNYTFFPFIQLFLTAVEPKSTITREGEVARPLQQSPQDFHYPRKYLLKKCLFTLCHGGDSELIP